MEFLPRTLGTRPRLALEVRAEGVVAARAEDAAGLLSAVSRAGLADGLIAPGLKPGNVAADVAGRAAVVAAVRRVLEAIVLRGREVTLVVPDAAVRVLLLDFDSLPGKAAEALPVVRFRLKKLLPFDPEDAAVSYQVMATQKGLVQVVAVAIPQEVLAEYEGVVREAGFEPGAVLPSTLAALAGLAEGEVPALVVNAGVHGVTTAIVRAGVLLLHRSVDLRAGDSKAGEEVAGPIPAGAEGARASVPRLDATGYGDPVELAAGMQTAVLERELATESAIQGAGIDVAQAVSVAAAYFEDTLEVSPGAVLSVGTMGAEALAGVLAEAGVGPVAVREMVETSGFTGAGLTQAQTVVAGVGVPRGWLAGVRGALAN